MALKKIENSDMENNKEQTCLKLERDVFDQSIADEIKFFTNNFVENIHKYKTEIIKMCKENTMKNKEITNQFDTKYDMPSNWYSSDDISFIKSQNISKNNRSIKGKRRRLYYEIDGNLADNDDDDDDGCVSVDVNYQEASINFETDEGGYKTESKEFSIGGFYGFSSNKITQNELIHASSQFNGNVSDESEIFQDKNIQTKIDTKDNESQTVDFTNQNAKQIINNETSFALFESNSIVKLRFSDAQVNPLFDIQLVTDITNSELNPLDDSLTTDKEFNKVINLEGNIFNVINRKFGSQYKLYIYDMTPKNQRQNLMVKLNEIDHKGETERNIIANNSGNSSTVCKEINAIIDYCQQMDKLNKLCDTNNTYNYSQSSATQIKNDKSFTKTFSDSFIDNISDKENCSEEEEENKEMREIFQIISQNVDAILPPPKPFVYPSVSINLKPANKKMHSSRL